MIARPPPFNRQPVRVEVLGDQVRAGPSSASLDKQDSSGGHSDQLRSRHRARQRRRVRRVSPDLPGVVALGDTEAETIEEMWQAIEFHLEGMREDGEPIPQPSTVAATLVTTVAA